MGHRAGVWPTRVAPSHSGMVMVVVVGCAVWSMGRECGQRECRHRGVAVVVVQMDIVNVSLDLRATRD